MPNKLREHGAQAPAEVLQTEQTRLAVTAGDEAIVSNTELVWKLKLQVKPKDGRWAEARARAAGGSLGGGAARAAVPLPSRCLRPDAPS